MKSFLILLLLYLVTTVWGLKCKNDENCLMMYTSHCQNFTCVDGFCTESEYQCFNNNPIPCQNSIGICSLLDGQCYYPKSSECDDGSLCTQDTCKIVEGRAECQHDLIPGCTKDAEHAVSFTVLEMNKLDVQVLSNENIKICHSTAYRGPESVSLVSFTPYEPLTLRDRGNCDNHPRYAIAQNPLFKLSQSEIMGDYPCVPPEVNPSFVMAIAGMPGELFTWTQVPLTPTMVLHESNGKLRVQGYLVSVKDPLLILNIDLHFEDVKDKFIQNPYLGMYATCYKMNLNSNPRAWGYYGTWYGTMTALHGSPYFGLTIDLTSSYTVPQLGYGANGVNTEYGIYAEFGWNIVSQPYDKKREINSFGTKAIFKSDVIQDFKVQKFYASLFEEPQRAPVNGWTGQVIDYGEVIQYCRVFTLYDLLSCRNSSDPYTQLFKYVPNEARHYAEYKGAVYATSIVPCLDAFDCKQEKVIDNATFNLTLVIGEKGIMDVKHETVHLDLQVVWDENVWLRGAENGNLKVNFRTRLFHEDMHLNNPMLDTSVERGYPLTFDDTTIPVCTYVNGYCEQSWTLRSKFAKDVTDFKGFKTLSWDVRKNDITIQRVHAHMSLEAFHVGDQSHAIQTEPISANLGIYTDRNFTNRYNNDDLTEGDALYGLVCLDKFNHLDIHIRRVYLCYSETADTIPFDPQNPTTTGCNTPDIDVKEIVIYSSEFADMALMIDDWRVYQYDTLYSPPNSADCEGFEFLPRANTPYRQTIQVIWYSQENGGVGGMVELLSERLHRYSRHVEENEALEHFHFHVSCPFGTIYSHAFRTCVSVSEFHMDDDDSFDGYHNFNDSVDNTWILLGLLSLIFIVIIFCCAGRTRVLLFKTELPRRKNK